MVMFFRRHSFAGFVSFKSWLKCCKPAESLLGTLEMIAKRQTTSVSFHRVCETFAIICLNPLRETIVVYLAAKRMKCSYIYQCGLDLIALTLLFAFYYTTISNFKEISGAKSARGLDWDVNKQRTSPKNVCVFRRLRPKQNEWIWDRC